ncbi:MAG: OmpH family outer membrane protein [Myxococcota bacterium]|jgi:outer membrane protein|nr:OmpH family outer membrane protein [Myxococcota bacterium]
MSSLIRMVSLSIVLCATSAIAQQSDARIGIIRLQDALTGCKEGKAARKKLQADFTGKQNQLKNREAALKRRYEQLEKQKETAKETQMRKDLASFQKSVLEAQQLRAQLQQELAQKEAALTRKILARMKPLIAKIARKGGYTVILDAGQVLHAPDDLDVTNKLIQLYDKENP